MTKKIKLQFIIATLMVSKVFSQQLDSVQMINKIKELDKSLGNKTEKINLQNQIIEEQKTVITKMTSDIEYFKKTLDLFNSKTETETADINFKINSIKGNSNTGEVLIEGILENKGTITSIQGAGFEVYDPQGNVTRNSGIKFGDLTRIGKLMNGIPTKFKMVIKDYRINTPIIKALILKLYLRGSSQVVFKNLNINWK